MTLLGVPYLLALGIPLAFFSFGARVSWTVRPDFGLQSALENELLSFPFPSPIPRPILNAFPSGPISAPVPVAFSFASFRFPERSSSVLGSWVKTITDDVVGETGFPSFLGLWCTPVCHALVTTPF